MGHDISGYKTTDLENEIAYLRRSAFSDYKSVIYKALNCEDCSGGVSGNGTEREFTQEELLKAKEYLGNKEALAPEKIFILDCLANLDENKKIIIGFY